MQVCHPLIATLLPKTFMYRMFTDDVYAVLILGYLLHGVVCSLHTSNVWEVFKYWKGISLLLVIRRQVFSSMQKHMFNFVFAWEFFQRNFLYYLELTYFEVSRSWNYRTNIPASCKQHLHLNNHNHSNHAGHHSRVLVLSLCLLYSVPSMKIYALCRCLAQFSKDSPSAAWKAIWPIHMTI